MLFSMYSDEINYAYLAFLKPILTQAQQINKSFESNDADPTKLLNGLVLFLNTLIKKIVVPSVKIDVFKTDIQG